MPNLWIKNCFNGNLWRTLSLHYCDVIIVAVASQITSLTRLLTQPDADQRKHQSSASLAVVRGIHRGPVNSPHNGPVTGKMFPFDEVIMEWCMGPISTELNEGVMNEHGWLVYWYQERLQDLTSWVLPCIFKYFFVDDKNPLVFMINGLILTDSQIIVLLRRSLKSILNLLNLLSILRRCWQTWWHRNYIGIIGHFLGESIYHKGPIMQILVVYWMLAKTSNSFPDDSTLPLILTHPYDDTRTLLICYRNWSQNQCVFNKLVNGIWNRSL